jgi:type I restriction enzyme M protein
MPNKEQTFLDALDRKLWNAADKLRSTLDASQYKHAVLYDFIQCS